MAYGIDDAIFDFAYELAMRDATMRTAYTGASIYTLLGKENPEGKKDDVLARIGEEWKTVNLEYQKEHANEAKKAVKCYIDGLFSEYKKKGDGDARINAHKKEFQRLAAKAVQAFEVYGPRDEDVKGDKRYKEENETAIRLEKTFTFGNAQKLFSMTAKYLFISTYRSNKKLREAFKLCYCPMDSIVVDKVIRMINKKDDSKNFCRALNLKSGWKTELRTPWSKIESDKPDAYYQFERIVRALGEEKDIYEGEFGADEKLFPLEFDYYAWAGQSKHS